MKFLTRTIIVLVVFNLAMGSFALAQAEGAAEPKARRRAPVSTPPETAPPVPVPPVPTPVAPTLPAPPAPSPYPTRAKSLSQISSRKVLVIPATNVKVEDLVEITQDLQVMSHIFDERFKEPRTIKGMFTDFGDFFGRDNRETEAIYIQGYGTLFLMEVNFIFTPPPKSQEQEDEETAEDVDPTWQRAKQKIFSPQGLGGGSEFVSEERYNVEKIDQLKTELIRTLKHAANIRNLTPDEWIILTVIGQSRQPGEFYEDYYRSAAPRSNYSSSYSASEQSASSEGGGYAASRSSGVAGGYGGMGGMGGGIGGMSRGRGGMGGFGGGMMGGMAGYGEMMGGMAGYGEMSLPSATVMTIRAKKTDVDDFARDELDFDQFQEMVEIFTY